MYYDDWGVRSPRWAGIHSASIEMRGTCVRLLRAEAAPGAPPGAPTQVLLHGLAAGAVFVR